jgi:hypothetical protein
MNSDPTSVFGALLRVCIKDEWTNESMLAATAISFALGVVASGVTAYLLTVSHAFL